MQRLNNISVSLTEQVTVILLLILILATTANAERAYLYQWDSGAGQVQNGWTWYDDLAYGNQGWLLNTDGPYGGQNSYSWGAGPRNFRKSDYGNSTSALIVTNDIAPTTTTGGALKLYDDGQSTENQATWWVWYDGEPLVDKNITSSETDRWSFYIKLSGVDSISQTNEGAVFHVGTYLCKDTGEPAYGTGDGCPYEGPGNQHYYHYLHFSPDAWIHVELDQHPQHLRGSYVSGNNPSQITSGFNYLEHLQRFYMEVRYPQESPTSYMLDEMYFYSTSDPTESAEPSQNEESVTTVWVGYWGAEDKWRIHWNDASWETADSEGTNDYTQSTFEVRWSTAPITNANYNSANVVKPEWYSYPDYTSVVNGIRRVSSYTQEVYTQFELPNNVEIAGSKIYFAIKDVSVNGGNAGTLYPWNRSDGHNAASSYIRTIDYVIPLSTVPPTSTSSFSLGGGVYILKLGE